MNLPFQVWLLSFISLFADIASEMLYPIIPIFITTVLGGSHFSVGIIEGFAELTAAYLKIISGRYIDHTGKGKFLIAGGYALSAIAKPFIGAATIWPHVLSARCTDRMGKGLRSTPRDVFLSEMVEADQRGKAFGLHRGMDSLGAVFGPLLGLWLMENITSNLREIFAWSLFPGLIAAALCLLIRTPVKEKKWQGKISELFRFKSINKDLPKNFYRFLLIWGLFCFVNSSDMFLILKAKENLQSFRIVILLYCLYNLVYAFASPYLGSLSDRIPRTWVISGGLAVFALVYGGFVFASNLNQYIILFAIYGLFNAATDGVGKAFASDLLPQSLRGAGIGLLGMSTSILLVIASAIAGVLWDHISPQAPFILGACGALISALLMLIIPLTADQKNGVT